MSHPDRITDVTAAYGQAHQYWDIYFTDLQRSYADATEDMRSISIDIDTASGAIRLNQGYDEGSPEFASETSLFSEYEPAIVEILVKEFPSADPAYKAFLEMSEERRVGKECVSQDISRWSPYK